MEEEYFILKLDKYLLEDMDSEMVDKPDLKDMFVVRNVSVANTMREHKKWQVEGSSVVGVG